MGYFYECNNEINIAGKSEYQKAVFGLFHIGFINSRGDIVFPSEDKDSIYAALNFYHKYIVNIPLFPVYENKSFILIDSKDKKVFNQILGLPSYFYDHFDSSLPIEEQLTFVEGLNKLKKEYYRLAYKSSKRKWYTDDFKLYCLKKGVFFLYDETKTFLKDEKNVLPVFFDYESLSDDVKDLYDSATSDRLVIDFLNRKYDKSLADKMKEFDRFSLQERISYFINHQEDERFEIDDLFLNEYTKILKMYIVSIINYLYDQYCFDELSIVNVKTSFLHKQKLMASDKYYSISSFGGEMFSLDGQKYYLSSGIKDYLKTYISYLLEQGEDNVLALYSKLALPYEGYKYVKDLKEITAEAFIEALPFLDIPYRDELLSFRRFDDYYSYTIGEIQYKYSIYLRQLLTYGICVYSDFTLLENYKPENKITMVLYENNCPKILSDLLFNNSNLSDDLLRFYLLAAQEDLKDLSEKLKLIDEKSDGTFLVKFFNHLKNKTIHDVLYELLFEYDLQNIINRDLCLFFYFAIQYLIMCAQRLFERDTILKGQKDIMLILDNTNNKNDSIDAILTYPYVSMGARAYAFRKDLLSTPYLCSCQKEAIDGNIKYYENKYKNINNTDTKFNLIISKLSLPSVITNSLRKDKNISSQLQYKDHICHLCNDRVPYLHPSIDDNVDEIYNAYLVYIRQNACKHGLYLSNCIDFESEMFRIDTELSEGTYNSIFDYDKDKVDPILLPYLNISVKAAVSLIIIFNYAYPNFDFYYRQFEILDSLGDKNIYKMLFDCSSDLYSFIIVNINIFMRLVDIYKNLSYAYAFYVSKDIIDIDDSEYCLNFEYNAKLIYPYTFFGNIFNVYCKDLKEKDFVLCECDKESLIQRLRHFSSVYSKLGLSVPLKATIVLSLCGLPFEFVMKYADYDFTLKSVDDFINSLHFEKNICAYCNKIPSNALSEPFKRVFALKEDMTAEKIKGINLMVHDGFIVNHNDAIYTVKYNEKIKFKLDSKYDSNLPFIDFFSDHTPKNLYAYFVMGEMQLKNYLDDFNEVYLGNKEVLASMSSLLIDTYLENNEFLLDFINAYPSNSTIEELIKQTVPQIDRVRDELKTEVMNLFCGFIVYLFENLINKYARKEKYFGGYDGL